MMNNDMINDIVINCPVGDLTKQIGCVHHFS